MSRSTKKGPFVDEPLLTKITSLNSSGGRHPVTPWGKPTKGKKTRTNKSTNKFILLSRHKRKK